METIDECGMVLLELDGTIASWNAGAEEITRLTAHDAVGRSFSILFSLEHPERIEPAERLAAATACAHGRSDGETWGRRRDESVYRLSFTLTFLTDERGEPRGYSLILRDTTELRHSEEVSEERLRLMVEGVQDYAIFMLNSAGFVRTWNAGASRIKQYAAQEIIGKHFSIFYPAEAIAAGKPRNELMAAARDGKFEEQGWRVRKDGSTFWANAVLTALRDKTGELVGFSKVTRDLSERRAAEEAVRRSEARFAGIVRISEDAIISIDDQQTITLFNDGAEKVFGYTNAQVLGRKLDMLIPPRFRKVHGAYTGNFGGSPDALRAMNERGSIYGLRSDGTEFPAEASISKFEVGGEKVLTVRLRDITERKRAEEAVKRSEARFAGIVRISEDAIISVDDNQNITLFNEGAEKIFGYSSAEVMGKGIDILIPGRFGLVHHGYIAKFGESPDALRAMNERGSLFGLRKDGTEFPAEASISKFELAGEKVLTVRLRDITERKRAEEQIRNSLAEKEVLLKEIHHRVKNNLQVVSSLLSLQSGDPKLEPLRELFIESQNRVKSMALIHEKLYLSADFSNIDFADYIESLARNLFHSYGANPERISLTIEVDVELDIDHAIPCGLIINELLSNALKHAFPNERHGGILLRFRRRGRAFILDFSDDGIGLPPGINFRETESLGLQLVTTLTSQIGGKIERLPMEGTGFEISFEAPQPQMGKEF